MKTANQCCCMSTKSQFSMRKVFNYCSLLFLGFVLTAGSWCIQSASAQQPSGSLQLVGPSPDPSPGDDIEIEVKILNPQNVSVFTIEIEYPTVFDYDDFEPGAGQFDKNDLSLGREMPSTGGRKKRQFVLGINHDNMGKPILVSEGTLFTITFETADTIETGHYQVKIIGTPYIQDGGGTVTDLNADDIPSLNVPVRGPMAATVHLVPTIGSERVGETGFIDIELEDRSRAHRYEITVDPSANLGPLTVSYNSDDTNITAITNHNAGDPITISADLWLPNDPLDHTTDWHKTYSDPIVATLFFTPTTAGEGSFEITEAKIFDSDDTALTLSNPDPLTFTIDSSEIQNIVHRNTGVGPKPTLEVEEGTKDGPFEVKITFLSKNYIEKQLLRAEDGKVVATFLFQRGIYGFGRDEIEVGGTAGASVTTRFWEADGAGVYYARINPTETGAREVTLQVPAGVVYEVGTNLPNIASETVTVSTNLAYPPWDVDENGAIEEIDAELVEAALGQGMEDKYGVELYVNTIENPRTDVNGDRYVNQVDVDLVRMHITDNDGGAQGNSDEVSGQAESTAEARSTEPDPSVWMPDANLRKEMRKKFGIKNDSELTQARMSHLTNLGFRNDKISDITGLEYAVNLTALVIRKTQVSDLEPLKDLTALRSLKLVDSNISDVSALGGLIDLTFLNVSGNTISDITTLGNLVNLTELWATDNNISDISALSGLTQLRKLRLRGNPILDTSPIYPLTKNILRSVDISVSEYPPWDVNEDGSVDATDSALVTAALGQTGASIVNSRTDVNGDGTVNQDDLTLVTDNLDTDGGAPSISNLVTLLDQETLETLDRETLKTYLNALYAESDGSPKYLRAIAMIERLLATTHPKQTQLLANYPNPFNPETWIPYQLANASDVRIIIYNTHGTVVRQLDFGHQPEGYYTTRDRAAYWDGRNTFGERVASGIYFYQLQADNISSLRKLLILK